MVHRLDQDTSGLVLFAKSDALRERLQDNWRAVTKIYRAVVVGVPDPPKHTITTYLTETKTLQVRSSMHSTPAGRLATTHYRLLRTAGRLSLVEIRLETGRKHQIRVHLAALGCPVVGDERYGTKSGRSDRLALHATHLGFDHPVTGAPLRFNSPMPTTLVRLLRDADRE